MNRFLLPTKTTGRLLSVLLLAALLITLLPIRANADEPDGLITSYAQLKAAIHAAKDGDTLLVGNLDFTPPGDTANSWMRIETDKSLTIRGGKTDGKSVLKNGSFILSGAKTGGGLTFRFENVIFDGGIDTSALKTTDFDYPWDEVNQEYLLDEPRIAQYALSFKGSVNAAFVNCEFLNYTHEYGPIMHVRYGDYTAIPSLLEMFGDYSGCTLSLTFDHCRVAGNAAFYDGGAIFLEGSHNVSLTATHCVFEDNYSGEGNFRIGGGAIYADGADVNMENCDLLGNSANHLFPDMELPDEDKLQGGALYLHDGTLNMINCRVRGNSASMGGALALTNADGVIEGCLFTGNRAEEHSTNWTGDVGPWNNMAQGGAIYHTGISGATVTVINSAILNNSAQNAYGGVYSFFGGVFDETSVSYLDLRLCTYVGNTCDSAYDYSAPNMMLWASHPGDIREIPTLRMSGCLLIDDTFAKDFPHHDLPTGENDYNYAASPAGAASDGLTVTFTDTPAGVEVIFPEGMDVTIPAEYAAGLLNGRYDGALTEVHVGSNYTPALYGSEETPEEEEDAGLRILLLSVSLAAVAVLVVICLVMLRRQEAAPVGEQPSGEENAAPALQSDTAKEPEAVSAEQAPAPQIVKAWFTEEEIRRIMQRLPKVQTLTGRETEVFRELLQGKKQKEIAYDLGIEITTVKDFCRKIYDKLDCANKDELLRLCSARLSES